MFLIMSLLSISYMGIHDKDSWMIYLLLITPNRDVLFKMPRIEFCTWQKSSVVKCHLVRTGFYLRCYFQEQSQLTYLRNICNS